ncbi:Cupredoxins domain-containing protein, partial [Dioscorea alata]
MNSKFLLILLILQKFNAQATNHIVGDSLWTIPISNNFYSIWSNNKTFSIGDNLVFKFETGFYNVLQVSRREYEDCKAENYFQAYFVGPANVSLAEEGMYYFITDFANYCFLGLK